LFSKEKSLGSDNRWNEIKVLDASPGEGKGHFLKKMGKNPKGGREGHGLQPHKTFLGITLVERKEKSRNQGRGK